MDSKLRNDHEKVEQKDTEKQERKLSVSKQSSISNKSPEQRTKKMERNHLQIVSRKSTY